MSLSALLRSHPDLQSFDVEPLVHAVEAALDCAAHCSACADACLREEMDMSACVRACRDCEEICRTTAAILSRPSRGTTAWIKVVEACIAVCEQCADECEKHANGHCRACAESCRACAEACRRLLAATSG